MRCAKYAFLPVVELIACALLAYGSVACGAGRAPREVPAHPGPTAPTAPPGPSGAAAPAPPAALDVADAGKAPKIPLLEQQQRAIRGMVAAFNAHDAKALAAFYSPDALVRSPTREGFEDETGRAAIETGHAALFTRFPDVKIGARVVYVSGQVAIWTWISGGTDSVGVGGAAPTNAKFGFHGASVLTFGADGLVTEDHTYFDPMTMAGQLGKLPKGVKVRPVVDVPAEDRWWREALGNETERKAVATAKGVYDALARGDLKAFLAPLDDKGLHVQMSAPQSSGKVDAKAEFAAFRKSFADPRFVSTRAWGIDLTVVSETTLTATYSGGAGGAGRPVTLHFLDIVRVTRDGARVAGAETYDNRAELLAQAQPAVRTP